MSSCSVSIKVHKFVLDESMRPSFSTTEQSLLKCPLVFQCSKLNTEPGSTVRSSRTSSSASSSFHQSPSTVFTVKAANLVADFNGFSTEVILEHSLMSSLASRALLLQIAEAPHNNASNSSDKNSRSPATEQLTPLSSSFGAELDAQSEGRKAQSRLSSHRSSNGATQTIIASGVIDPYSFLSKPSRDYAIRLERQFTIVGKLFVTLHVEPVAAKRLSEKTVLQRVLQLRIDRVHVQADAPRTAASRRASLVSGIPEPTGPSFRLTIGAEYVLKVKLISDTSEQFNKIATDAQVRSPMIVCDDWRFLRWGGHLVTLPLPQVPMVEGGGTAVTSHPDIKVRITLYENGRPISTCAVRVDKLNTQAAEWANFQIPSPLISGLQHNNHHHRNSNVATPPLTEDRVGTASRGGPTLLLDIAATHSDIVSIATVPAMPTSSSLVASKTSGSSSTPANSPTSTDRKRAQPLTLLIPPPEANSAPSESGSVGPSQNKMLQSRSPTVPPQIRAAGNGHHNHVLVDRPFTTPAEVSIQEEPNNRSASFTKPPNGRRTSFESEASLGEGLNSTLVPPNVLSSRHENGLQGGLRPAQRRKSLDGGGERVSFGQSSTSTPASSRGEGRSNDGSDEYSNNNNTNNSNNHMMISNVLHEAKRLISDSLPSPTVTTVAAPPAAQSSHQQQEDRIAELQRMVHDQAVSMQRLTEQLSSLQQQQQSHSLSQQSTHRRGSSTPSYSQDPAPSPQPNRPLYPPRSVSPLGGRTLLSDESDWQQGRTNTHSQTATSAVSGIQRVSPGRASTPQRTHSLGMEGNLTSWDPTVHNKRR